MPQSYWDWVKPTYIENWAAGLYNLSIPSIDLPITLQDAEGIADVAWGNKPKNPDAIDVICSRLDEAIAKMPNGAFVRLGSRSPKDAGKSLHVTNADQAMTLFVNSERVFDDLILAIGNKYTPHIWVRQWIDIPKDAEFRCFMKNRKLVGISQYYYFDGAFKNIIDNSEQIQWAIQQFFSVFSAACHLDSVVFDVYLKNKVHGNEVTWDVRLLEINPFFELTDPCLFTWSKPKEFNGDFRYIPLGAANAQ